MTGHGRYFARVESEPALAIDRWMEGFGGMGRQGPFQSSTWLRAWYDTLGRLPDVLPLLATVHRQADGQPVLALPLVLRRNAGLRCIEFADLGVTDYAAPWFLPEAAEPARMGEMFRALRDALPPADVFRVEKCLAQVSDQRNPLLALRGVRTSPLQGHVTVIGEDHEAWRLAGDRRHRKAMERCWRVFQRHRDAHFSLISAPEEAMRILLSLESQQRETAVRKGWNYLLDNPGQRDFYRRLLAGGLADGSIVLSALQAEGEVAGALLGLRQGDYYAMLRVTQGAERWRPCSPGRLVMTRTIAALHAQGVRRFDFTIGDYRYKQDFLPEPVTLREIEIALSWRGSPGVLYRHARRRAADIVRRLRR